MPGAHSKTLPLVLGLGLTCTIGYGTILYAFSLLSIEIEKAFAWSNTFIFGVYSFGVLLAGLTASKLGSILDQFGARIPMCAGSVIVASSFIGLANMTTPLEFVVYMLTMEVSSILVIYESAFVALTHVLGQDARRPISQITLMAGFASTIFWPLIAYLLSVFEWRAIYVFMALLHLLICLPIHWLCLQQSPTASTKTTSPEPKKTALKPRHEQHIEILVAGALGLSAFCIVGLQLHIFSVLEALEVPETLAVAAGALIGPFQVISRLTDMLLRKQLTAVHLSFVSLSAITIGIIGIMLSHSMSPHAVFLFAIFFGIGQGLTNIVRGALPLQLFGALNYGSITGRLNRVRLIMSALAPISFTFFLSHFGAMTLTALLLMLTLASIGLIQTAIKKASITLA